MEKIVITNDRFWKIQTKKETLTIIDDKGSSNLVKIEVGTTNEVIELWAMRLIHFIYA